MRKVGSTTDTADANGEYTNGNVAQGIPPTIINAEMLNTFQRELIGVVEGAGMELDPADDNQVVKAIDKKVGGGRLLNIKTFTSSGTYTPTPGTQYVIVEAVGGGGGGGGCATPSSGTVSAAAGGNSGTYGKGKYTINGNVAVTVGTGGAGGIASDTTSGATIGEAGGDTKFGTLLTCPGGNSGLASNSFQIPNICQSIPPKTLQPTGANIASIDGESGGNGFALGAGISGKGGSNPLGSGGASVGASGSNSVKGNDGSGYGSGGSGAFAGPSAQGKNGGNGAPGLVIVWEFT
ncbi:phage tail protein [Serratia marcescens]|nr:phage tail protein [Serratia marcescens]